MRLLGNILISADTNLDHDANHQQYECSHRHDWNDIAASGMVVLAC